MASVRSAPVQSQVSVTQLYKKLEIVGKGAYGSVHRGIHIPSGDVVALKIINLDTPDDDVEDIQREVALLSQLRGPGTNNITKYYGCYLEGPRVWIVMDFASGGSVRTLMKATKGNIIEERYSVVIVREVLGAFAYLHKSGVIHRDVKAANILVTEQGRVMLCDFGVAALLPTTQSKRTTFVGTPYWMAPEVITSGSLYDSKADIWSLGVTLYEMATGSPPHADQREMRVLALIPKTKPPRLADHQGSKDMRDFLTNCLRELPGDRATAEELVKTKWIKNATKIPVSTLKDLIGQYEAWSRAGGVRQSLIDEESHEDNESMRSGFRESTWEFETVRRRSGSLVASPSPDLEEQAADNVETSRDEISPPRVPPRSLRMLFEDAENPASLEPFRIQPRITTPVPTPSPLLSAPHPADPAQEEHNFLGVQDGDKTVKQQSSQPESSASTSARASDPSTARQATFAFPTTPRPPNKYRTTLSSSEDESLDRPSHVRSTPTAARTPTYREVRNSRGLPDISIPPPVNRENESDGPTSSTTPSSSPFPSMRSNSVASSTASSSSSSTVRRARKGASPVNFQFPATSRTRPRLDAGVSRPTPPPLYPEGTDDETGTLSSAHHSAHSMDSVNTQSSEIIPNPIARSHSATPGPVKSSEKTPVLSHGPSLNRQGSLAVMETVIAETAPLRIGNATPALRNRSGSAGGYRSDGDLANGLRVPPVPLKDVLKLSPLPPDFSGAADLLPPSPSAISPPNRPFAYPASSHSAGTSPAIEHAHTSSPAYDVPIESPANTPAPPPIRPLDFSAFVSSADETHAELARTVDSLARWLSAVENGLGALLDRAAVGSAVTKEADTGDSGGHGRGAAVET